MCDVKCFVLYYVLTSIFLAKYRIYPKIRTSPLDLLGFIHILKREVLDLHEIRYFAPQMDNFFVVTVVSRFRHRPPADTPGCLPAGSPVPCRGLRELRSGQP